MAEVEATLNVTKITTTLAQHEQLFSGAFSSLIKGTTMRGLRASQLSVIDLSRVDKKPFLIRKWVDVADLTEIGATARKRALLEGERRFCGNKTEVASSDDHSSGVSYSSIVAVTSVTLQSVTPHDTRQELTGALVIASRQEMLATLLDLRTVGCTHLSSEQAMEARQIFEEEYVTFALQASGTK